MKKYKDIEHNIIITENELKVSFEELKRAESDEYNYSFDEYIKECTGKNGTLEEII